MSDTNPTVAFDYRTVHVNQIELVAAYPKELPEAERRFLALSGGALPVHGGKAVTKVLIGGEPFVPTGRFWTSLYSRFGLNNAFFKFFNHEEVFRRISERESQDQVRITVERNALQGDPRLLAATGLNKPIVVYDDLMEILQSFQTDKGGVRYHDGVVVSSHEPRIGQSKFKIGVDDFSQKYELHCPVDGYGQPAVYLALLRWICSNGAVGFANAFKTSLVLGSGSDNTRYALQRALDSFTNDEGYAIMRGRFDTATRSWASIRERQDLYRVLLGLQTDPILRDTVKDWKQTTPEEASVSVANSLLRAFGRTTGDPFEMYRADPHLMSPKRQRSLPVACRVYDMLNFATELATHHVSEAGARQLQAWVGNMLSSDYDLEDSADEFDNWRDLFLNTLAPQKAEATT
jgi:hypothetical protein